MAEEDVHGAMHALGDRVARVETVQQVHTDAIAELKASDARLAQSLAGLRETIPTLATRSDVAGLRADITHANSDALRDAQAAVPAKVMAWFTGALVVLAVAALFVDLLRHA